LVFETCFPLFFGKQQISAESLTNLLTPYIDHFVNTEDDAVQSAAQSLLEEIIAYADRDVEKEYASNRVAELASQVQELDAMHRQAKFSLKIDFKGIYDKMLEYVANREEYVQIFPK